MRDILYIYNVKEVLRLVWVVFVSLHNYEWVIIDLPSTNKNLDPNKWEFGFLKVDHLLSVSQPSTISCHVPLESL